MLSRQLKTVSSLFIATLLVGAFLTLPSLGMELDPLRIADDKDTIIRGNPISFAQVSRDHHAYVCKKGFIIYRPESYQLTKEEGLLQLQSLMNGNRQISMDYILPCPPIGVSDYHTNVVISLLDKSEIPVRELELCHAFNADIAGTEYFDQLEVGLHYCPVSCV